MAMSTMRHPVAAKLDMPRAMRRGLRKQGGIVKALLFVAIAYILITHHKRKRDEAKWRQLERDFAALWGDREARGW
jgi:hypothetical protein